MDTPSTVVRDGSWWTRLAAYLLAGALAGGLQLAPHTLGLALVSFGVVIAAVRVAGREREGGHPPGAAMARLDVVALALLLGVGPTCLPIDDAPAAYLAVLAAFDLAASALLGVVAAGDPRERRAAMAALLGGKLLLLVAAPVIVPRPPIDVWLLQQHAVDCLLAGRNPYTTPAADIYEGRFLWNHQIRYAYAPLNLWLSVPSKVLLGDYRFGLVASLAAAVLLLRATGRRLGVAPRLLDALTLTMALHPRLDRMVIHGWMEPYLVLGVSLFAYWRVRAPGQAPEAIALFCLPLLKQYFAVPVLLYMGMLRPRWSAVAAGAAAGALVLAPVALLGSREGAFQALFHFIAQVDFRPDSISLAAALDALTGWRLGAGAALAAQLAAGLGGAWALRGRGLGGFLLATALALFASFLCAPQAFLNYYFFLGTVLVWAALALAPRREPVVEGPAPPLGSMVARTTAIGAGLALAAVVAVGVSFQVGCRDGAEAARARLAATSVLLAGGDVIARPGDDILECTARHCAGPLCHEDLLCVCAPAGSDARYLDSHPPPGRAGPFICRLDDPARPDGAVPGASAVHCRNRRCSVHAASPRP